MSQQPEILADGALAHRLLALWPEQTEDHALLFLDDEALIVGMNSMVERVLGYSLQDLLKRPLSVIFDTSDIAQGLDRHEIEVARELGRSEDDRWHVRKDGRRFWAFGVLTSIRDAQGNCIGFVKVLRDRTDLRAQISAIENRLMTASGSAQAREQLLGTFAHEIRNPMNALAAALAVIKRQKGEESRRAMEIAEKQLRVMARLAEDLREMTRIDNGTVKLELIEVDLQAAISAAVELHSELSGSRGQTVSVLLPDVAIMVRADAIRLEQILGNLLDNAFKYTPRGGRVWVTATVEGPMAVVRIRDEGEGISPEMLPRIFDMFTRDARAIESATDGLGIGLAVVKNLVQLHHGTIEVHTPGQGYGSEFTVNLPVWNQTVDSTPPVDL